MSTSPVARKRSPPIRSAPHPIGRSKIDAISVGRHMAKLAEERTRVSDLGTFATSPWRRESLGGAAPLTAPAAPVTFHPHRESSRESYYARQGAWPALLFGV